MIKALMKAEGKTPVMVLGLSAANVERLKKGEPIYFTGEQVGVSNLNFAILYGETEEKLIKDLGLTEETRSCSTPV